MRQYNKKNKKKKKQSNQIMLAHKLIKNNETKPTHTNIFVLSKKAHSRVQLSFSRLQNCSKCAF